MLVLHTRLGLNKGAEQSDTKGAEDMTQDTVAPVDLTAASVPSFEKEDEALVLKEGKYSGQRVPHLRSTDDHDPGVVTSSHVSDEYEIGGVTT